jgi:putative transposase
MTSCIQKGKPSKNGYVERFNRTFREDILDMNIFENIHQIRDKIDGFLEDYNNNHPHDSLGDMSPIEFMNRKNQKKSA